MKIVFVDNHDSFVYNLVDTLVGLGHTCQVFRNDVSASEVIDAGGDVIVLSPGPGHPRDAGCLMEVIANAYGCVPILGVCLGFQALLLHEGISVRPCGPVHGKTDGMFVSRETPDIFDGLTDPDGLVPVARYHSLGIPVAELPENIHSLGECGSALGPVAMVASFPTGGEHAFGVQFHPESILTPQGPVILNRILTLLTQEKEI
ncbi:anthranilate synthase component II [uncultured Corynebacterium sp.]|mgnify:CR=1 FL=1|uniref:glutamine amidotransferase-related protein n=1 Tax=uncultured Corynebacterium sp. TaxID=159447 RepID=UPI0026371353|nr:anthranilate synthase component II [uncultured Corynebacterium sp.]